MCVCVGGGGGSCVQSGHFTVTFSCPHDTVGHPWQSVSPSARTMSQDDLPEFQLFIYAQVQAK